MEQIELTAEKREVTGKKVKRLRQRGLIPAIIYGPKVQPIPIQINQRELIRIMRQAGMNRLINVRIQGDPARHLTLIRDVQRDPISRNLLHLDFQEVVLTETITATVPIVIEGEPSLVEQGEAVLNVALDEIEIEALPTDLLTSITLDVSGLKEIEDAIYVRDLPVSDKIKILTDPDEMIVGLSPVRMEVEEAEEELEEVEIEAGEVEAVEAEEGDEE